MENCLWHNIAPGTIDRGWYQPLETLEPCCLSFQGMSAKSILQHLAKHVNAGRHSEFRCLWSGCRQSHETYYDLRHHLLDKHSLTIKPFVITDCPICHDRFEDEFSWASHGEVHDLRQASCSSNCCSDCFHDESLSGAERLRTFNTSTSFHNHRKKHARQGK